MSDGAMRAGGATRAAAIVAAVAALSGCAVEEPLTPADQIFAELCRDVGVLDALSFRPAFEEGEPIRTVARVTYGPFGGGALQLDRSSHPAVPIELIRWKETGRGDYAVFDMSCRGDCVAKVSMAARHLDLAQASWRAMGGFDSSAQCGPLWRQGYIVFDVLEMRYAASTSSLPDEAAETPAELGSWLLQSFGRATTGF